jgi:hypothetical protein
MFNRNFEQIRPRPNLQNQALAAPVASALDASIQSMVNAVNVNSQAVADLIKNLNSHQHQTAFSTYPTIDLTTAHTDKEITVVRPVDFIQVWCDGGSMDGMSIKIGTQSEQPLDLKAVPVIRVMDNPEKIYFTNDVRQGRSHAVVYFVRGDYPLQLTNAAGQDISQGELAVRNGSISTFDRRGQIMWQDDFEDSLRKWYVGVSGLAYIVQSTDICRSGNASIKMYNPDAETCQLSKALPWGSQSKFGFEISFARDIYGGLANCNPEFEIGVYDGTNYNVGKLVYDQTNTSLFYLNAAGGETALSTAIAIATTTLNFNTIKLVIDPIKGQYVRGIMNGYVFDMRNIPLFASPAPGNPRVESIVSLNTVDGINPTLIYVDDAIVTSDED